MTNANATFELKDFDEETVAETDNGGKITRAKITRALTGDIEGEAVWETVMAYGPDGHATIVGLERVVGRLRGRDGSFVLSTTGTFNGKEMRSSTEVVEGSATGGLAGLRGKGSSAAPHGPTGTFTLDYTAD